MVSLDAALLFTVTSLAVYLCATKHLRFPNKQWWSTPNCKARMLFLFTDKVAFFPSPDCPFCEFQESDVKSAWFHSGLNFSSLLEFAVKGFCTHLLEAYMDSCCIILSNTCRMQSFVIHLFAARKSTFCDHLCECLFCFSFSSGAYC